MNSPSLIQAIQTLDAAELARRARKDFITVTELADTLVRREGMSFHDAHALVAQTVRACGTNDDASMIAATLKGLRPSLYLTREEIEMALDPGHFVRIRGIVGGPAPETAAESLAHALAKQQEIEAWVTTKNTMLDEARAGLLRSAVYPG